MSATLVNVAPVFLLILTGWVVARIGILNEATGDALGEFVFKIAVPMLIFRTLADTHFEGVSPFRLWIAYFAGVAVTWTAGHLAAKYVFGRDDKIGVIAGMSAAFANNVFIGLPLVGRSVGDDGLVALSILLAIHLPLMMIVGTILMERASVVVDGGQRRSLRAILLQVGSNLIRNPLVIALAAGLAFNLSGLTLTPVLGTVVGQLSNAAGPAALISIGMALTRYPVRGNIGLTAAIAGLKLFLLPAAVFLMGKLLGLSPAWSAAIVLTSSVPTGINAWLIAHRFRSGQNIAASTISVTTAFGIVSVSFWAWLLA
ncbi:AEC family transporter [Pseudorhizobium endolithicum]|uniref:AEC family transporter n=1 Tax=Pseudorhizobium endolithicum TaxID=1191678 RepID=A0ABN7JGF7_9HYPH|nr:AEC family transporter [Pseudorhizobium endolithicum]CAD7030092.1 AEC family transporter [Pseudorhizobium endolithicum]